MNNTDNKQKNSGKKIALSVIGIIFLCILTFGLSFIFSFYYIINPDASIIPETTTEIEAENKELKTEIKNLESVIEQLETQLAKNKTQAPASGTFVEDTPDTNTQQSTDANSSSTNKDTNNTSTTQNNTNNNSQPSTEYESDDITVVEIQ